MKLGKQAKSKSGLVKFSQEVDFLKLGFSVLAILSVGLASLGIWVVLNRNKVYQLTLAAGDSQGESYLLSKAIAQVVAKYYPNIQIAVKQTGGTSANIKLLEANEVQLATAQADVPTGSSARIVSVLYQDLFQLVVKDNSGIKQFADLRSKRIGLQQKGGQYRSFIDVAAHYGMNATDFRFAGSNDQEADDAFRRNQVDAVFRVRAPGNRSVLELVRSYQGRLLPIAQAAAMKIKYPAFENAFIPQGAYRGILPVPAFDLPTVAVPRNLLVHKDVDEEVVANITGVLDEHRQELADAIAEESVKPLVASINRPNSVGRTGAPIHPGALAYYDRDKPSFVQANADYVALILTVILLLGEWLRQLKSWAERQRKDSADAYISVAIELMNDKHSNMEEAQQDLDRLFGKAAADLVAEKISQESFRTFNEAYKTAREAIDRKKLTLVKQQKDISDEYIKKVLALMKDDSRAPEAIQVALDLIMEAAADDLVGDKISQESFRTFIEAYKTARDSVNRKDLILR